MILHQVLFRSRRCLHCGFLNRGITETQEMQDFCTLDLAVMVDVYHELLYPVERLQAIKHSLKSGGKLLLIDYRGEDLELGIKKLHKMTVEQIKKELTADGFRLSENGQFKNIQHFSVFEKE